MMRRCIQCGGRIELTTKHENRKKCGDCIDTSIGAKEMYHQR